MTLPDNFERVLHLLDISPEEKKLKILNTIARAGRSLTIEEIQRESQIRCDTSGTRAALYRTLSQLAGDELIRTFRESGKKRYVTDSSLVDAWFVRCKREKINELRARLEELRRTRQVLEGLGEGEIKEIADYLYRHILSRPQLRAPIFNTGADQLVRMLHEKIIRRLRKGDIVRISLEWGVIGFFDVEDRTMDMIERLLERGIKVRILGPSKEDVDSKVCQQVSKKYIALKNKGGIEIRHKSHSRKTYHMIAKNRDDVVLVLAREPSLMLQYIPYGANPELVDDIIHTFDEEFKAGLPCDGEVAV